MKSLQHPTGAGTPLGDGSDIPGACVVCHMPRPNRGSGAAAHIFRINVDAKYSTFPTQSQWNSGQKTANTSPDGTYNQAVWLDANIVCGQCHGGSAGMSATISNAPYMSKAQLSVGVVGMHGGGLSSNCKACHTAYSLLSLNHPSATGTPTSCKNCHTLPHSGAVNTDTLCGRCHGGSAGPSATQNGAPYIGKSFLSVYAKNMHINVAPKTSFTRSISSYTVTLTDTSTDDSIFPANAVKIKWGDGTSSQGNAGSIFSHTYATAGKFNIVYIVIDSKGSRKSKTTTATVPAYSITVDLNSALTTNAKFILMRNGITIRTGKGTASYVFSNLKPGAYKVKMSKSGFTFDNDAVTIGNQNPITVIIGSSDQTVTFTHTP